MSEEINKAFDLLTAEAGDELPNGALLLATRSIGTEEYVVLGLRTSGTPNPFVTWRTDRNGGTVWGHYFDNLHDALSDLRRR